jgi:hypothetical protein
MESPARGLYCTKAVENGRCCKRTNMVRPCGGDEHQQAFGQTVGRCDGGSVCYNEISLIEKRTAVRGDFLSFLWSFTCIHGSWTHQSCICRIMKFIYRVTAGHVLPYPCHIHSLTFPCQVPLQTQIYSPLPTISRSHGPHTAPPAPWPTYQQAATVASPIPAHPSSWSTHSNRIPPPHGETPAFVP